MFEDVTDGDESREPERNERFDAVTVLVLKRGSGRTLCLRDLRLVGATRTSRPRVSNSAVLGCSAATTTKRMRRQCWATSRASKFRIDGLALSASTRMRPRA